LGTHLEIPYDARVMCATHKDLDAECVAGRFRQDLLFRLNVIRVELPPLRERGMDIVHLAQRFLLQVCERDGLPTLRLSPEVAQRMLGSNSPEEALAAGVVQPVITAEDLTTQLGRLAGTRGQVRHGSR